MEPLCDNTGVPTPQALTSIERYDGRQDPAVWLDYVQEVATLYHWSDATCLLVAKIRLTGNAKTWSRQHQFLNWAAFQEQLECRFGETKQSSIAKLENCCQLPDESVRDFADRFLRNAQRAGRVEDAALVYNFTQRLQPELRMEVARRRLHHIEDIVTFCDFWTGLWNGQDENRPPPGANLATGYQPRLSHECNAHPRVQDSFERETGHPEQPFRPRQLQDSPNYYPTAQPWQRYKSPRQSNPPVRNPTESAAVENLTKRVQRAELNQLQMLQEKDREIHALRMALQQQQQRAGTFQINNLTNLASESYTATWEDESEDDYDLDEELLASLLTKHPAPMQLATYKANTMAADLSCSTDFRCSKTSGHMEPTVEQEPENSLSDSHAARYAFQAAETPAATQQTAEVAPDNGELWDGDILAFDEHLVTPGPKATAVPLTPTVQAIPPAQTLIMACQVEIESMLQDLQQDKALYENMQDTQNMQDMQDDETHDMQGGYSGCSTAPAQLLVMVDTASSNITGALDAPTPMKGFIPDPGPVQSPNLPTRHPPVQFQPYAVERMTAAELLYDGDLEAPVLFQHFCPGPVNLGYCLQLQQEHSRRFNTQADPKHRLDEPYGLQAYMDMESWHSNSPTANPKVVPVHKKAETAIKNNHLMGHNPVDTGDKGRLTDTPSYQEQGLMPKEAPTDGSCTLDNTTQPCTAKKKALQRLHEWVAIQLQEITDSQDVHGDRDCVLCGGPLYGERMMVCDGCGGGFHTYCLGTESISEEDWLCNLCAPKHPQPNAATPAAGSPNLGNPPLPSPPSHITSSFQLAGPMHLPDLLQLAPAEVADSSNQVTVVTPLVDIRDDTAALARVQERAHGVKLLPDDEEDQKKAVKHVTRKADTSIWHLPTRKTIEKAPPRRLLAGKEEEASESPAPTVPPDKDDKKPDREATPPATAPLAASGLGPGTEQLLQEWAAKQDIICARLQDDVTRDQQNQKKEYRKRHRPLDGQAYMQVGSQVLLHKSKMAKWIVEGPYELMSYSDKGQTRLGIKEAQGKAWVVASSWLSPYHTTGPTGNSIASEEHGTSHLCV